MDRQKTKVTHNDFITNKIMVVIITALLFTFLLMMINRGLGSSGTFMVAYYSIYVICALGVLGLAFGLCKSFVDVKKGRDVSSQLLTGHGIALCSLIAAASMLLLLFTDYNASLRLLYIVIPSLAVLYLIFMIYQREYFALAALGGLIALYFWRFARYYRGSVRFVVLQAVLLLVCLCMGAALFLLKRGDGTLTIGRHRVRILKTDAEYRATFVFLALYVLLLIAAFFIPNFAILYLAYTTLALVFVMAVYYAVRMM